MVLVQEFRMEKKTGAFEDNSFKRTSHVNSCRTAGDWLLKMDFTRSTHQGKFSPYQYTYLLKHILPIGFILNTSVTRAHLLFLAAAFQYVFYLVSVQIYTLDSYIPG